MDPAGWSRPCKIPTEATRSQPPQGQRAFCLKTGAAAARLGQSTLQKAARKLPRGLSLTSLGPPAGAQGEEPQLRLSHPCSAAELDGTRSLVECAGPKHKGPCP